uniref:MOB kinase activator-like 1 n=1 Tax=Lygus hesperus TaxID=30085 RepID=A0A0A9YM72_LYGHE
MMLNKLFGNRSKTLRAAKDFPNKKNAELSQYAMSQYAKATLGSGNMRNAVQLPPTEDLNEWLAVNTVDFFNEISLLYGTATEFCTRTSCPSMNAGDYKYLWMDGVKYKKPTEVSAPEYVDLLMEWIEAQLNDEQIFPLQVGTPFSKDFILRIRKIFQRLFRIYAHIYLAHFPQMVQLGAEAHLNTCFKHFIYFVEEFHLIDAVELEPLRVHIVSLMGKNTTLFDDKE